MTDEPTVVRREDQIIVQPRIVVPPLAEPIVNVTVNQAAGRRDILLAIIAAALIAGLFV